MSASLNRKLRQAQVRLQGGDAAGAQSLCEQVLRAAPRNPDALYLMALAQLARGQAQEAIGSLKRALAADPRNGAALENLGLAHLMLGEFGAAENALARAAQLPGAPPSVFMRLGVSVLEQGRSAEALPVLRRAAALDPQDADSHLNLGRALADTGDIGAAREHFQTALALSPQNADAAFNLGVLALRQGEHSQAREHYLAALEIAPNFAAAHEGLASACITLGRAAEAIPHLRATLAADPDNAQTLSALAQALYEVGQLEAAETAARRAIALNPVDAAAYATLANRYLVRGEYGRAIDALESGYEQTQSVGLLGMLTYQLRHVCEWGKWRKAWSVLAAEIERSAAAGSPFWLLCEPTTAEQQLGYTRRWAAARFEKFAPLAVATRSNTDDGTFGVLTPRVMESQAGGRAPLARHASSQERSRLRIGYLSSDLHEHATAYLIAEVLECHDRERFEVFAYSYGPEDRSPMRERLRAACEHFVDIAREGDDAAARRIHGDALDVLIDLKGYTLGDRLTIMARRPCATQATWLGYPGTTGAPFMDYLIADSFVVPPEAESAYSERVVRLPHCYQPNDRKRVVAETRNRSDYALPEGAFVYCCFNQSYKISPELFAVWMRLLHAAPAAVLWLLESNPWAKDNLLASARDAGVAEERLVFAPRLPNAEHLARYRVADLALDTFPYTSHTTLSDALWCGCPTVALCGETFAARVSGSLLTAAGLSDMVTYNLVDYEALAARLATDTDLLHAIRARVAQARDNSPLFDSATFTRALEALYVDLVNLEKSGHPRFI